MSFSEVSCIFQELTGVPTSRSSCHRLVQEYGGRLVAIQTEEAAGMVKPPAKFDEEEFRQVPEPDSEVMNVSMDGAMIHVRGEGWKEVKTVVVSAVKCTASNDPLAEPEVELVKHSYRAGLWEATTFTNQQWAEAMRRGVEKAKQIVSVNDGAAWIWGAVRMCYEPCVQVLDWWHALQKLWLIALLLFGEGSELGPAWVNKYRAFLWAGNLRPVFRYVRTCYPRGEAWPEGLKQALGYFYTHRHRMKYEKFRREGYPIGSGTVESACKTVAQARMKQAGMRWSRDGAQAMLALRSVILSDRWNEVWPTLAKRPKAA
jgi:hypothetical protein